MELEQILSLRYPLPEESLDKLHRCMSEITLPKGFHILEINKVEKDIFSLNRVLSGLLLMLTEKKLRLDRQGRCYHCFYERICKRRGWI